MKIYSDISLENFEFWSGAVDTAERITEEGKWNELEAILEDLYPDGITDTQLNDLLWFEPETVYGWLGISDEDDKEEEKEIDYKEGKTEKEMNDVNDMCNKYGIMGCENCPYNPFDDCYERFNKMKKV